MTDMTQRRIQEIDVVRSLALAGPPLVNITLPVGEDRRGLNAGSQATDESGLRTCLHGDGAEDPKCTPRNHKGNDVCD